MSNEHRMRPPPPGCAQVPFTGDNPIQAERPEPAPIEVCCLLHGDWPGSDEHIRKRVPDLGVHYVQTLYGLVSRYAPLNTRWNFTCFTDRHEIPGIRTQRLPEGMWSYMNKLYLFSQFGRSSRVLFFDLDTVITGNWGPLAEVPLDKPVFIRDQWANSLPASGVMSWMGTQLLQAWGDFHTSGQWMNRNVFIHPRPSPVYGVSPQCRTDEQWLYHYLIPNGWRAWEDLLPGQLKSYKYDVMRTMRANGQYKDKMTPEEAKAVRVVYFHGRPRPHEVVARWNPYWRNVLDAPQPIITADRISSGV